MKKSTTHPRVQKVLKKLRAVYKTIPDTKGCMENLSSCESWCCRLQSPSLLYCEFLNTWQTVINSWKFEDIANLIERSMRNYLTSRITKGCVFWDEATKLCKCHTCRPYNCYIYGITPDEEFQPRLKKMQDIYKDDIMAVFKDQCKLCSTVNCSKLTVADTDRWWKEIVQLEHFMGIDYNLINDGQGGTYRMFHEHILLHICPDNIMSNLSKLKQFGTSEEKDMAITSFMQVFRKNLQDIMTKKGHPSE